MSSRSSNIDKLAAIAGGRSDRNILVLAQNQHYANVVVDEVVRALFDNGFHIDDFFVHNNRTIFITDRNIKIMFFSASYSPNSLRGLRIDDVFDFTFSKDAETFTFLNVARLSMRHYRS